LSENKDGSIAQARQPFRRRNPHDIHPSVEQSARFVAPCSPNRLFTQDSDARKLPLMLTGLTLEETLSLRPRESGDFRTACVTSPSIQMSERSP
jgi:hypothetical protein